MSIRTFRITNRDGREYVGAEYPNGWHVLCPVEKPEDAQWSLASFQSAEPMVRLLGSEPVYLDADKSSTTTKPPPPPCPDCQGPPDVIAGLAPQPSKSKGKRGK